MERLEAGVVTREFQTVISVFSLRRIEDEERGYRKEPLSGYARPKSYECIRLETGSLWFLLVGVRCSMQIAR